MRRILGGVLALVGCLVAILALLPLAFSNALLRAPMIAQIEARTGLVTEQMGRARIAFLPTPHLSFKNLRLRDKSGTWRVEAHAVSGELRVTSLLVGRLELKSLTLVQPNLVVDVDAQPFGDTSVIARALRLRDGSPDAVAADATPMGTLRIVAGTMRVKSRALRADATVANIDAVLVWPLVRGPAELSGRASWAGHEARFEAATASPLELLRGLPSQTTLRLRSDLADLDATGSFAESPREQFVGTLRAATPSLRDVGRMTGLAIPIPGPLGAASIEGEATLAAGKLWLSGLKAALDGNAFEGSMAIFAGRGRSAVSGTLATDLLQLDPIAGFLPALHEADGHWTRDRLNFADLAHGDIDLRISAARARLGGLQVEDAALSVLLKDSRLDVALVEAKAYGGTLRMRAVGLIEPLNIDLKLDTSFSNIDLASLFAGAPGDPWISGTSGGTVALQSSGSSPAEIVSRLDGRARFDVEAGDLIGIDLEKALRRVQRGPLGTALDVRGGRTAFDHLMLDLVVAAGIARVREGTVAGPAARIAVAGAANLAARSLDVRATATQTGVDGDNSPPSPPQFSFSIGGTWDAPYLEPDAAGLIRGSGAAAPLFLSQQARVDWRNMMAMPIASVHLGE